MAIEQGNFDAARELEEESLAIQRELGDLASVAQVLNNLGELAYYQADYATARARLEQSVAIYRQLGNDWGVSMSVNNLEMVARAEGNFAEALARLKAGLFLRRKVGDTSRGVALSLENSRAWRWARLAAPRASGSFGAAVAAARCSALPGADGPSPAARCCRPRGDER